MSKGLQVCQACRRGAVNIQSNNLKDNKYANYLIPEFKKAIHVLQNLQTYGKSNGPAQRPGTQNWPEED